MSDKTVISKPRKPSGKILKWSLIALSAVVLEAGGIAAAVKITESRTSEDNIKLKQAFEQAAEQNKRIEILEKLPAAIAANTQRITANFSSLNLLTDELNRLKEETGNNKIKKLEEKMADTESLITTFNHRIDSIEENKSTDALILSLVLLIKENALYHRDFSREAEILAQLAQEREALTKDIETINLFRNVSVADNELLAEEYSRMAKNLSFDRNSSESADSKVSTQQDTVSKSIQMIKDTVAGINFDKVVVLKDKKTDEQKLLLVMLGDLVKSYNFTDALTYIEENPSFNLIKNQEFTDWQEKVKNKLAFESAISHITAAQLNNLRQEIKDGSINIPQETTVHDDEAISENKGQQDD